MSSTVERSFIMKATPVGEGIDLKEDPWRIEDKLEMVFSHVNNNFFSVNPDDEAKTELLVNGALVFIGDDKEKCRLQFEKMKERITESGLFPSTLKYNELELEKFTLNRQVVGTLENLVPRALLSSIVEGEETKYTPKFITFEFLDVNNPKNFIRISFREYFKEQPLIDVSVESNSESYANMTLETLLKLLD